MGVPDNKAALDAWRSHLWVPCCAPSRFLDDRAAFLLSHSFYLLYLPALRFILLSSVFS